MILLLASQNAHKLQEVRDIFKELFADAVEIHSAADHGFDQDVDETGSTFEENALLKAEAVFEATGLPTIADDSGLCVDALGGAPGIYSARYGGEHGNDAKNNETLLKNLAGVTDRSAKFVSAIAFVSADCRFVVRGEVCGEILEAPSGQGGFGYDPLFYYEPFGKTLSEVSAEEKNSVSHRRRGLTAAAERLQKEGLIK